MAAARLRTFCSTSRMGHFIATGYCRAAVEPELEFPRRLHALFRHELNHFHARVAVMTVATEDVVSGDHAIEQVGVHDVVLRTVMRDFQNIHAEPAIAIEAARFGESFDEVIPAAVSSEENGLASLLRRAA